MATKDSPEPEKKAAPRISPARAKEYARLTRRAALFRYTNKKFIPTARSETVVDYEQAFAWLPKVNQDRTREKRVTLNHLALKAVAQALRNHIYLNYAYDGGRHLHPVDQIDLRSPVDLGDFPQFVVIKECDQLSVEEIADRFYSGREAIASSVKTPIEQRLRVFGLPWFILSVLIGLFNFQRRILRLFRKAHAGALERERSWLGSYMVSNMGTLGTEVGGGVIVRPSISALGIWKIGPKPVAVDDQAVVRRVGKVSIAFDHRLVDGGQATRFLYEVRRNLQEPEKYLTKDPAPPMFPGSIGGVLP